MSPQAAQALLEALLTPFAEGIQDEERRAAVLRLAHAAGFEAHCATALATVEPSPPWHETVLADRVRCYGKDGSRQAIAAKRDLALFLSEAR